MMDHNSVKRSVTTPESGFTLLELLVAMTLLGLLMTVLFGALRFGAHAWDRAADYSSGIDEIRLAQMHIRRAIEFAYPHFISDPERSRVDFEGTADGVTFLAPAANALISGGRARIILRRAEQNGTLGLVIEARPELALPEAPSERDVLVNGLKALQFSYYGGSGPDDPPQWTDHWRDRTRLPELVRISAEFVDDRLWPEFSIAPRLSADVSCVYDVLTKHCRGR